MPGRGFAPKLKHANDSTTRKVIESMTRLPDDGVIRGQELLDDREWPQATLDLWDQLRRSPMAAQWLPADWSHLQDTALLHAKFWEGDSRLAPEIRLRLSQFGVTPEARLRLRLLIDDQANQSATPALDELMRRRQERNTTNNPLNPATSKKGTK
jgi:hypothetical protein